MPIIKSAIKRDRQSKSHRLFNRAIKANVKNSIRSIIDPIKSKAKVDSAALSQAFSTIDKAVKKGVLHKNTAARKKARITRIFNSSLPQKDADINSNKKTTKEDTTKKTSSKKEVVKASTAKKTTSKK